MLELIYDIEKALQAKAFRSALALALTLPSICCSIEFKNSFRETYIDWIDKRRSPKCSFYGEAIYALRCAVLHLGDANLIDKKGNKVIDDFEFTINGPTIMIGSIKGKDPNGSPRLETSTLSLNIIGFCKSICSMVRYFYEDNKDKYNFGSKNIQFIEI